MKVEMIRDKIATNERWLICPACGRGKVLKLLPLTTVKNLPVFCKRCHTESIVNISTEPEP